MYIVENFNNKSKNIQKYHVIICEVKFKQIYLKYKISQMCHIRIILDFIKSYILRVLRKKIINLILSNTF